VRALQINHAQSKAIRPEIKPELQLQSGFVKLEIGGL
jgi:hypothetical protein